MEGSIDFSANKLSVPDKYHLTRRIVYDSRLQVHEQDLTEGRRNGWPTFQNAKLWTGDIQSYLLRSHFGDMNLAYPLNSVVASDAQPENRQVNALWLIGMPHARGQFGLDAPLDPNDTRAAPYICVNESGGTNAELFPNFLDHAVYPLYPDMNREDPVFGLFYGASEPSTKARGH